MPYSRGVINAKPRLVDSTSTAVTNEMRCFSTKIIYGEAGIYSSGREHSDDIAKNRATYQYIPTYI